MFKLIVFFVLSAALIYLSRASLRAPRSHGFYRFFAAEFVLALVLLNLDRWFQEPFSSHQIASWLLLAVSVALVIHGAYLLKVVGKPDSRRSDEVPLTGIEKTTSLVTVSAYKFIRHPIYSSGFYGTWGIFFKPRCSCRSCSDVICLDAGNSRTTGSDWSALLMASTATYPFGGGVLSITRTASVYPASTASSRRLKSSTLRSGSSVGLMR